MRAPAPSRLVVRVTIGDTWMPVSLEASADERVTAVKARALATAHIAASDAGAFEVKSGGALVRDETRTLREIGIRKGSPLVILARRRRPVR